MVLSNLRRASAGVLAAVALLAGPAAAPAAVTILIEEIDAAGNPIGPTQTFTSPAVSGVTTANFTQITVGASSNSSLAVPASSISTGFSALTRTDVTPSDLSGLALRIVVTDTFNRPPGGGSVEVTADAGASTPQTGVNTVSSQTAVLSVPGGSQLAFTNPAIDVAPTGADSGRQTTMLSSIPADYQIQQTVIMRVTSDGTTTVSAGSAFSGSAAAGTNPPSNPIPAPGGLILALAAAPVLGLRRVLRRKSGA